MLDVNRKTHRLVCAAALTLGLFGCSSSQPVQDDPLQSQTGGDEARDSHAAVISDAQYGFRMTLPEGFVEPERTTESIDTEIGRVELVIYVATRGEDICAAAANGYSAEKIKPKSSQDVVADSLTGSINEIGANIERRYKHQTSDGHPAETAIGSIPTPEGDLYVRQQALFDRPVLYQLSCYTQDSSTLKDPSIDRFFQSFRTGD